jgi:hypothetical protein
MRRLVTCLSLAAALVPLTAAALVNFDTGQRTIKGIQLLQDYEDPAAFYYLPQFPRLAAKEDGSLELLCLKYVDQAGGTNGGLFHALIEFTLPPDVLADLDKELKKQVPGARIIGPVPLMQAVDNGEEGQGSFQIVSALLSDRAAGGFTRSVVTSGKAPLMPGSKAVVAAILNQQGATLLWDSFTGATSDVSVAIHAYYEAAVKGYNARVYAETSSVYEHFSMLSNYQKDYTKRQVRKVVDDLQRNGVLKVEVLDRTQGLGLKAADMEAVLQMVTDKLTELMFDHTSGWAADPPRETAVEAGQIQGRQERGWFSRTFGGSQDTKYFSDDQFVLKKRSDIRRNVFNITLSKSSTIKVPVDTAGNLGGLYKAIGTDTRYFRVVNLADPAFEFRQVFFQVDGEYVDSFQDSVNFVSVNLRKRYGGDKPDFTRALHFSHAEVKAGKTVQDVSFPRLGATGADWTEFEYQVRWGLRDGPTVSVPPKEDQWIRSKDPVVALVPPFEKRVVEIDADRSLFAAAGMASAVVDFAVELGGKAKLVKKATLRAGDAEPTVRVSVYHDRTSPVAMRVSWYSPSRTVKGNLELLESDYLFLTPPPPEPAPGGAGGGAP